MKISMLERIDRLEKRVLELEHNVFVDIVDFKYSKKKNGTSLEIEEIKRTIGMK